MVARRVPSRVPNLACVCEPDSPMITTIRRLKLLPRPRSSPTTTTIEHDRDPVNMIIPQRADQTETIVNTNGPDEALSSVAPSSEQTLFSATASPSSSFNRGDGGLTIVDMSKFTRWYPHVRAWTHTRETAGDLEIEQAKVLGNVNMLRGRPASVIHHVSSSRSCI